MTDLQKRSFHRALAATAASALCAPLAAHAGAGARDRPRTASGPGDAQPSRGDGAPDWAALERAGRGRLGVAWLDAASGHVTGHRLDERFPQCSTFKLVLAARVLQRVERGEEALDRRVDLRGIAPIEWSPAVRAARAPGASGTMDVAALCEAALAWSDNTAANLLLARCGGPAALTAWVRGLGDTVTRFDRVEPALNAWRPGELRDTTTPRAMAATLRTLLLGDVLAPASRRQLSDWLRGCRTGVHRLRAGLPDGWSVGDKTGTGVNGSTANDIALVVPPGRSPWIVTAYLCSDDAHRSVDDHVLASVGAALARAVVAGG